MRRGDEAVIITIEYVVNVIQLKTLQRRHSWEWMNEFIG